MRMVKRPFPSRLPSEWPRDGSCWRVMPLLQADPDEGVRRMTCITLTRVTLPRGFGALPASGWEVAYEGQVMATYLEEGDGWLCLIGSPRLSAQLRYPAATWGIANTYPNLDALRNDCVLRARAWEE